MRKISQTLFNKVEWKKEQNKREKIEREREKAKKR